MQNLAKKQWTPNLGLKDAIDLGIDFSIRARQKNVIAAQPPKIYYCYVTQDCPDLYFFHPISALFRFSQKDTPYIDQTRDRVLRMLSVATKAHFFLFHKEKVAHEPYFFAVPDLSNPSDTFYGLIYKIASQDKTIMVCERAIKSTAYIKVEKIEKKIDLRANADHQALNNSNHNNNHHGANNNNVNNNNVNNAAIKNFVKSEPVLNILYEFPTIVPEDSFKWFHYKKWYALYDATVQAFGAQDTARVSGQKNLLFNELKNIKNIDLLEQKAHILSIPYELKDLMMESGCLWHPGLKVWYLPRGHDLEVVLQYLNYLKHLVR